MQHTAQTQVNSRMSKPIAQSFIFPFSTTSVIAPFNSAPIKHIKVVSVISDGQLFNTLDYTKKKKERDQTQIIFILNINNDIYIVYIYLEDEEPSPTEGTDYDHEGSFEPVASVMNRFGTVVVHSFGPWKRYHRAIVNNHQQCASNCDHCSNNLGLASAFLHYYSLNPD